MKRAMSCLLLCATLATGAHADDDWAFGIGQRDQVTRGLVAYWSMRNAGTTVYDEIGAINGTSANTPTLNAANGVVGNGVGLVAASSQVINLGDVDALELQTFTISLWFKRASTGSQRLMGMQNNTGSPASGTTVGIGGVGTIHLWDSAVNAYISASTVVDDTTTWHHAAWTKSGTALVMYLDGAVEYSGTMSATLPYDAGGRSGIGALYNGGSAATFWNGSIDEVRVHNVALTHAEIKQLYRMAATIYRNR